MIRAILKKGKIQPVDKLPEYWREGQELIVRGMQGSFPFLHVSIEFREGNADEHPARQTHRKNARRLRRPGVHRGHRVRVQDIVVWHEKRGYSPDEIVDMFPSITLADVYAALTYYFDNRQEIEDELKKADEWAEWLKTNVPSKIPAELREKRGG